MANDASLETVTSSPQVDQIRELSEEVNASYAQTGASDQTLTLVRQYINALAQFGSFSVSGLSPVDRQALVNDLLLELNLGVSDPTIAAAIMTHVDDLAAGRACASNSPCTRSVHDAADPIEMFNGQYTYEATDAFIRGAGLNLSFRRVYKNQAVYQGPLGVQWDHSYNLWIRQISNTLVRSTGELREDIYTQHPKFGQAGFDYWVPPDGQQAIIIEYRTSYIWQTPNGTKYFYQEDSSQALFHRLSRVQDRFGNYLAFSYQDGHLQKIEVNHPDRFVVFSYDTQERIVELRDHIDRRWLYTYDDFGDLVSVTSPATQRYLTGLTTCYEYSSLLYNGVLQHNLLRIYDPAGQLYLENEYGTASGSMNFNRVIRQRQGGGEHLLEYEQVINEFEYDYSEAEKPVIQVNHVMRNGQIVHYVYNTFGNLLLREEYVRQRLLQWRYRYNRDGSLVGTITPEGTVIQYYFGRDDYLRVHNITDAEVATHDALTSSERLAFANVLAVVRRGNRYDFAAMNLNRGVWGDFFPDVLATFDPVDVVVKYTYENDYQQMLTSSDPRFTSRADPRYPEAASYGQHLTVNEYSALPLIAIGKGLMWSLPFPPPHTVRDSFPSYGVPSIE